MIKKIEFSPENMYNFDNDDTYFSTLLEGAAENFKEKDTLTLNSLITASKYLACFYYKKINLTNQEVIEGAMRILNRYSHLMGNIDKPLFSEEEINEAKKLT